MTRLRFPYHYMWRDYQEPIFDAIDNGVKRIIMVRHRRAGKDKTCFNLMVWKALDDIGTYYYVFPTYSQGKKALWD